MAVSLVEMENLHCRAPKMEMSFGVNKKYPTTLAIIKDSDCAVKVGNDLIDNKRTVTNKNTISQIKGAME